MKAFPTGGEPVSTQSAPPSVYLSREYVDIQVLFAERLADASGLALGQTLLLFTNLYRRMGLGIAGEREPPPIWTEMIRDVVDLDHDARVTRIYGIVASGEDGAALLLPGRRQFGCFACEPPDSEGMVRIHFGNRAANQDVGPLHASRSAERRQELKTMFSWLAATFPEATRVDGASWLYNRESYRRLFPADFAASRNPRQGPKQLHGLSTWGQFIDFRGHIRPEIRDACLHALPCLEASAPHRVFPYQVLFTSAPFKSFLHEYGV